MATGLKNYYSDSKVNHLAFFQQLRFLMSFGTDIKIRRATIADARAISEVVSHLAEKFIAQEFPLEGKRQLLSTMTVASIETYLQSGYIYHVAEAGERLVGVVGMRDNSHIYHLFVVEDFQRQGVAKKLWNVAREACLAEGNPGRFTVKSSRFALEMYKKIGFCETGPAENSDGVTAFPMAWAK